MRDFLLLFIVVGLVPLILLRPWVGILAWFWVGLMTPHKLTWGFMQDFQVAVVIGLTTLIGLFLSKDRKSVPLSREIVVLGVFVAYVTMTTFFSVNPSAWGYWEHFMKIVLMTFVTPVLIYGYRRTLFLLLVVTGSIAFYGLKGGWFALSTGGAHMVLGPNGSFLEGNTYVGLAMLMVLPLVLVSARLFYNGSIGFGVYFLDRYSKLGGGLLYGVFWLTGVAILATYSRGAFLGMLLISPFIFLHMRYKVVLVAAAFLLIGVVGVTVPDRLMERWESIETYEEDTSSMQRIQAWGVNWNMAKENPLTGTGFRNTGVGYDWWITYAEFEGAWDHALSAHSIYFTVMGQHGIGGLLVYLGVAGGMFLTLNQIRRKARLREEQRWLSEYAWAMQVGLIAYLGAGAFLDVAYFELFYAFVALTVIMWRELNEGVERAENLAPTAEGDKSFDAVGNRGAYGQARVGRGSTGGIR